MAWKKSKAFMAEQLGVTARELENLLSELRGNTQDEGEDEGDGQVYDRVVKQNLERGTYESSVVTDYDPKSHEELAELHKIDTEKYKISSYWSKQRGEKFTSSVLATLIKPLSMEGVQKHFTDFLSTYKPAKEVIKAKNGKGKPNVRVILPNQDAHLNKLDIGGDNDIEERFLTLEQATVKILEKASLSANVQSLTYIVGSDQFNSEWTTFTTKGTPQQNILSFHDAFERICDHQIRIISTMLTYADTVDVLFIPGNHDEYVGWHLVKWMEAYFSDNRRVSFDTSPLNRKYERYGNSALMFNHGDVLKAKDLAHKFPVEYKDEWSKCENYYIFTGDRHTELASDVHGIKFYQVPALSAAKSMWDDKHGHTCTKAEMMAFVITEDNGMTDIYKEILKY